MLRTVALLLFSATLHAQSPGFVVGTVVDHETGAPIPDASVSAPYVGVGSVTDSLGHYRIGPLPAGYYVIEATHIAYRGARVTVAVSMGDLAVEFRLKPKVLEAQEIVISANRAISGVTPVTFTNVARSDLRREHTVKDTPTLLQDEVAGVYAYSDAGNGVGYTYLTIRGFDQKRINVMINGVPLNDPEDHQVYWVDMPDLLSSTQDVQVQRGVGTALVGQYGLGGSVNLVTTALPAEPGMIVRGGLGSWGTRAFSFQLSSTAQGTRSMQARFSRVISNGYRDRTSSDLWSYFFTSQTSRGLIDARFVAFGGPIKTHAGWYAAHEDSLSTNRRFNPVVYANEIDSFNQPRYEAHLDYHAPDGLDVGTTLFYVRGRGYYEQYKSDRLLRDYGIVPADDETSRGEVVRQKHVKKDHLGMLPRISRVFGPLEAAVGGELSYFWSTHRGEVLWTDYADSARGDYYRYGGRKWNASGYLHGLTHFGSRVDLLTDVALQWKRYSFRQEEEGNFAAEELNRFTVGHAFLSPRTGVTVRPSDGIHLYGNVSYAQREPSDAEYFDVWEGPDDLFSDPLFARADTVRDTWGDARWTEWKDPSVDPERLLDYEMGIHVDRWGLLAGCALYLMRFDDEIIPYGRFDEDRGSPVTGNAPRTEHRGVELDMSLPWVALPDGGEISLRATASFSDNVIKEFTSHEDWTPEGEDLSGNPIPLFPNRLLGFRVGYRWGSAELGGRLRHVGKQYLDTSANEDRIIKPYSIADAWVMVGPIQIGRAGRVRVSLRVENLANRNYETSGYYDAWEGARYFWVGSERTFHGGITLEL
ncbi:TonB-dependent receptor [Candidatus Fermentibacteria bacterium]|nr:TonB-dependent receptor [Candidatus Fermentibacteria bacterium]